MKDLVAYVNLFPPEQRAMLINKAQESLLGAIGKLEEFGWIQGEWGDEGKGYCAHGAMQAADANVICLNAARLTIESSVARWNDADGRTYEDVVLMFKESIGVLEDLRSERVSECNGL